MPKTSMIRWTEYLKVRATETNCLPFHEVKCISKVEKTENKLGSKMYGQGCFM